MGSWVLLSLLAVLSSGTNGASLPYHDGYDWHFDQMGVHLDLALKYQTNPLIGGKAHVELPVSDVWKIIEEGKSSLLKELVIALEKSTFGKLYNIKTIKADITFNGEKALEGIFNIAFDYTLVHKDGSEEKATLLVQGKNESGKIVTSVEVISKALENTSYQICSPLQITLTCNWPNAHAITINGSYGKIFVNIANNKNEVTVRGVWEYLGHQYKYSSVLSLKDKFFTLTYQDPSEQPKHLVVKLKVVNNFPRIEISGNLPTTRGFKIGEFKTELIQNNLYDYEIKHTYNGLEIVNFNIALTNGKMDMTLVYENGVTQKSHIIIEYTKKMVKVVFPRTNTWLTGNKKIEVELEYQPTNEANLLGGGNIKIVLMSESLPIFKIGGYYGLTINAAKYELLFNDFYAITMNNAFKDSFSEAKFYGKIFIDCINKNGLLNKISVEAKAEKDKTEMFNIIFATVETPYKLHFSCPYLFTKILSIINLEHLEIRTTQVIYGEVNTITITSNLTKKKLVAKITPTMVSYELLDDQVSLVKYLHEFKIKDSSNSYLMEGKSTFHLNEKSYLYQVLCTLSPSFACFKDLTTNYHLEVVDKAAGKVNVKVVALKDTVEMFHVEVNNVLVPYKIILKAPMLPFEIIIEYEQSTKEWKILINNRNKKSMLKMESIGENKFELNVNGVPLVQMVLGNQQIQIVTLTKDVPAITAIITWKTFSIFENCIGIQILYKKIAHKVLFGWNINQLKKAFVDLNFTGYGTNLLGDYELNHHINWNIIDIMNIDLMWNGKALATGLKYLNTPLMTDGKVSFNNYVIEMKVVEKYNDEPYTLIFKNKPLKIALLPFFEFP